MKVYIVLEFSGEEATVKDLFVDRKAAIQRIIRLKGALPVQDQSTFHIISKPVKGLAGIKFVIDGKKRYLTGTIRNHNFKKRA